MEIQARKLAVATKFPVQNSKVWSEAAGEGYQSGCSIWMPPPDREAYPPPSFLLPTACLSVSASQVESFISSREREGGEILAGVESTLQTDTSAWRLIFDEQILKIVRWQWHIVGKTTHDLLASE